MIYPRPSFRAVPDGGTTLVELLVALVLASLLALGLVQMVSAATAADSLQRNQAQILDRARFAANSIGRAVRQAGFRPDPWSNVHAADALGGDNFDRVSTTGDRLDLRTWSNRNCFGNRNPDRDTDGRPRFYLRETTFDVNAAGALAHNCRYGPDADHLTTQIRRQALVQGVESFQVQFSIDADSNGNVDGWVPAGQWPDADRVVGVRVGLLLASDDAVTTPATTEFEVLGELLVAAPDGRIRRLFELAFAIRGRSA